MSEANIPPTPPPTPGGHGGHAPLADQPTVISDFSAQGEMPSDLLLTRATDPNAGGNAKSQPVPATAGDTVMTVARNAPHPLTGDPYAQLSGAVWGDFRLEKLIGRGGMGAVYKGVQLSLDRTVAVKVLPSHLSENEDFRQRFQLEAKAVAQLNSPHVIQVYGAGVHDGHHYFAMEHVEGADLSQRLKSGFRPTHAQALELLLQAARGLVAAGEHGLVHRDVKPGNMMVTAKGVVKLMDFGLVKLASEAHSLTMTGTVMGTVTYFSPEQGRGERCDQRTDLYALGVVFYELLTGHLPFTGGDATSIIYQHIHSAPKPPKEIDPTIPEDFQAVVLKCMQKRADDRYQSAIELVSDLERLAQGKTPVLAFADPTALRHGATVLRTPEFKRERQRNLALIAGAGVLLAAGAVTAWALMARPQAPTPAALVVPGRQVVVVPHGTDPAAAEALLGSHQYGEARRLAQDELLSTPTDATWLTLLAKIDRAQGEAALTQAQAALDKGDIVSAGTAAASARALLPDAPQLKTIEAELTRIEGERGQRTRMLAEADNLLSEGSAAKAEALLAGLAAQAPDDVAVANALRRARAARESADALQRAVREQVAQGQQALQRKDYDAAQLAFTSAKQLDPKNAVASVGLNQVTQAKQAINAAREQFDSALRACDLATADARLADLRSLAPGSPQVVLAEAALANSRLADDDVKRQAEEREAQVSNDAKALLAKLDDLTIALPVLEKSVQDFVGQRAGRPEAPLLTRRLDDRRARAQVQTLLGTLDQAVVAHDSAAIERAVADADFAARLGKLGTYQGVVFASTLTDFVRSDDAATAKISLRQALATYPEKTLTYLLDLRRQDGAWRIASAHLQP